MKRGVNWVQGSLQNSKYSSSLKNMTEYAGKKLLLPSPHASNDLRRKEV
jgi:hypothetical protein